MEHYDPLRDPDPAEWEELDESERIDLVMEQHQASGVELPNVTLHATIHVVVENQLVLGEEPVQAAMGRLLRQGLDRHEAVHAIGAVLAGHIHALLGSEASRSDVQRYYGRLKKLTAKRWRKGKW